MKRWIPNIKAEIQFCLHHLSGVRNYPEYKIKEFRERLERLQTQLKRWTRRVIELNPNEQYFAPSPGEPHYAYISKKRMEEINAHTAEELGIQYYDYMFSQQQPPLQLQPQLLQQPHPAHQSQEEVSEGWGGWSQSQWEGHWADNSSNQWDEDEEEEKAKEEEEKGERRGIKRKVEGDANGDTQDRGPGERRGKDQEREKTAKKKVKKEPKIATPLLDLLQQTGVPESEGVLEDDTKEDGDDVVQKTSSHPQEDQPLDFAFPLKRPGSILSLRGSCSSSTSSDSVLSHNNTSKEEEEEDSSIGLQLLSGYTSD